MKRYLLEKQTDGQLLPVKKTAAIPDVSEGTDVVVKIRACSLNYRDLLMKSGKSASSSEEPVVPLSDGAGEVAVVGSEVTDFSVGDRVALTFFQDWEDGPFDMIYHRAARGGSCDGVLAEYVAVPAHSVVKMPEHLSFAEAACLPCAAVTAWHALFERGNPLNPGQTVLCLGTGGVSIFALQLAKAAGARVIVTSSSDEKLERARNEFGADETINYRKSPDWDKEVYEMTEKRGVDHIIEVGGAGTLTKSMNAIAAGGRISMIGVLTGFGAPESSLFPIVARAVDLCGIYVGSRTMFERMNSFLSAHRIKPVIDREFAFDDIVAAYDYLESGAHFGKVVMAV